MLPLQITHDMNFSLAPDPFPTQSRKSRVEVSRNETAVLNVHSVFFKKYNRAAKMCLIFTFPFLFCVS